MRDDLYTTLTAQYEVDLSWIGGDFGPSRISAREMFLEWAAIAWEKYPDGRIPICWFVQPGHFKLEFMPGQMGISDTFRRYYSRPTLPDGTPIDWERLHVQNQNWTQKGWCSGGFIQHATGWKPAVWTSSVDLEMLEYLARRRCLRLVGA